MLLVNYIKGINCANKELKTKTNSSMMQFHLLEVINLSLVRADASLILSSFAFMAPSPPFVSFLPYQDHHCSHLPLSLPCFH